MDGQRTRTPGPEAAEKVLEAAAGLLASGGVDAISTRAVAAAAGVQPPTIYRQFGDKQGLLDAVTRYVFQTYYLQDKRRAATTDDPVQDFRDSWNLHVGFGLAHPDCYVLAYVQPRPGKMPVLTAESMDILHRQISRIGEHGQLKMSVKRAAEIAYAAASGYVLAQIRIPPEERDPELNAIMRENTIAAITTDRRQPTPSDLPGHAVALREALRDNNTNGPLSAGEKAMMAEWLDRLADQPNG